MATAILLSRILTLTEYGTYSQILLVINLVITVVVMGLPVSMGFFLTRSVDVQEQQKFISVYFTFSTALGFMAGMVLVLSASLIIENFSNPLIHKFVYALAVLPWTMIIMSGVENMLVFYHRTAALAVFRVLNGAALMLVIAAAALFHLGFSAYMLLFVIEEAIFGLLCFLFVRNAAHGFKIDFDQGTIRNIVAFSLPVGLASFAGYLNIEFGKLFVSQYFPAGDVAIYCIAALEMPFTIIALTLPAVLMPRLAALLKKGDNRKSIHLWGSSVTLSYAIICFLGTCMFVFAPEAITLLYTDRYLPGVAVFRIYTIILLLRVTYFGIILYAIGKIKLIIYSSLASLVVNMILCYILYNLYGFIGPALAALVSIALLQLLQLIVTSRNIKAPFRKLLPWKPLAFITMMNILFGGASAYLKGFLHLETVVGQIPETILLVLAWGLIYALYIMKHVRRSWDELKS